MEKDEREKGKFLGVPTTVRIFWKRGRGKTARKTHGPSGIGAGERGRDPGDVEDIEKIPGEKSSVFNKRLRWEGHPQKSSGQGSVLEQTGAVAALRRGGQGHDHGQGGGGERGGFLNRKRKVIQTRGHRRSQIRE